MQASLSGFLLPSCVYIRLASVRLRSADGGGSRALLDSWLPFLIYGLLAFAIPLSMIAFSFV
jgi:hypothetical protein